MSPSPAANPACRRSAVAIVGHPAARGPPDARRRLARPRPRPAQTVSDKRGSGTLAGSGQLPCTRASRESPTASPREPRTRRRAAPTRPPAIAATVSASRPPRTAFSSDSLSMIGTASAPSLRVTDSDREIAPVAIAHQAACNASTTQPFLLKSLGRDFSASTSRRSRRRPFEPVGSPAPHARRAAPARMACLIAQAPEHARLARQLVEVAERADGHRRLRKHARVVEVGEGDRRGPHQRAVARCAIDPLALRGRGRPAQPRPRRSRRRREPARAPGWSPSPSSGAVARPSRTSWPRYAPGRRLPAGLRPSRNDPDQLTRWQSSHALIAPKLASR